MNSVQAQASPVALRADRSRQHRSRALTCDGSAHGAGDFRALNLRLVLWSLQSPINIGMLLAEAYGVVLALRDSHGILADPDKRKVVSDFSCGAIDRDCFKIVTTETDWAAWRANGRLVATTLEDADASLESFEFLPNDLIVLGNEYDGLPKELCDAAETRLRVPMVALSMPKPRSVSHIDPGRTAPVARDGDPSLNVAMTGAIVCFAAYSTWLRRSAEGR